MRKLVVMAALKRIEYNSDGSTWNVVSETRYIYDGMRVIQERDLNNTPQVSYTRGEDLSGSLEGAGGIGGLLVRSHAYQAGSGTFTNHNYYHADGNGNITYMVTTNQGLAASYRYDPYGNLLSSSGSLASGNVYRFSSKEIHVNSGLYYYGYRWYAPNLQRWLNRDPLGERNNPLLALTRHGNINRGAFAPRAGRLNRGPLERFGNANLYEFVRNSPTGEIDPDGLHTLQVLFELLAQAEAVGDLEAMAWWDYQISVLLAEQEAAAAAAAAAAEAGAAGAGAGAGAMCAVASVGLVVGVGGGLLLGSWEPFEGGGTINENVQEIFEGFWDWWYK